MWFLVIFDVLGEMLVYCVMVEMFCVVVVMCIEMEDVKFVVEIVVMWVDFFIMVWGDD